MAEYAPSREEFVADASAWLREHARPRVSSVPAEIGPVSRGDDSVAVFHDLTPQEERSYVAGALAWQAAKYAAGYGALTLPVSVGGRGLPRSYEREYAALEAAYVIPPATETVRVTLNLVAPTIALHGSEHLRTEVLPRILTGACLVCQLFSEPDAGSDLASLRCRADYVDGRWIINGQKIWTSGGSVADYGELIARSDGGTRKHRGLTAFLIPMDLPGIEVRPIRQMTGGSSFSEVFFEDVELPDCMRIGEVGDGWTVTLTTLAFERETSGDHFGEVGGSWHRVVELARDLSRTSDPVLRQRLADLYACIEVLRLNNLRVAERSRQGDGPGALGSIGKLAWTQNMRLMSDVVSALLGPRLVADTSEWGTYAWAQHVLGAPGYRIAGGSDEVQRNIIAEKMLGLPRDPSRET